MCNSVLFVSFNVFLDKRVSTDERIVFGKSQPFFNEKTHIILLGDYIRRVSLCENNGTFYKKYHNFIETPYIFRKKQKIDFYM